MSVRIGRFGGLLFLGGRRTQLNSQGQQPSIGGHTSSVTYPQTVAPVEGFAMASGIYQIRNSLNGKRYMGSAINLRNRWQSHLSTLRHQKHSNRHLQAAFNKYGEETFVFEILEHVGRAEWLIPREQHYLDIQKPEYNLSPTAQSNLGVRYTEAACRRMSQAQKGKTLSKDHRRKLGEAHKGMRASEETRRRMSLAQKGRQHSAETRRKMSQAMRGERNPNYGKHHSIETRRKIGKTSKGKRLSEEHKRKISKAWTSERRQAQSDRLRGTHRSEETKQQIRETWTPEKRRATSEALTGEQNPNYGKHPSEETRLKMSQSQKARQRRVRIAKNAREEL